MKEQIIQTIIDTYLKEWVDLGMNKVCSPVEAEMADPNQDVHEEWRVWFPVNSTVTDHEIEAIENRLGCNFPEDYQTFLKHKHFYELYISQVSFGRHPIRTWEAKLTKMIFGSTPRKYLLEKGYIPFANWSDWGLLCFDSNRSKADHNYPIVLYDHDADTVQDQFTDFYNLLQKLDAAARKGIS
jgi:hypothetical protein